MATGNFSKWAGRWLVIASLGLAALTFGSPALADPARPAPRAEAAPAAGRARIEVMTVYANNSGQVDPRLKEIQRQLPQPYTGFQLLSSHSDQLGVGQSTTFAVEGGRKMKVTLVERAEDRARVRIELYKNDQKKVDTTVSIPRDRYFMFGGFPYQDGKLVVPVSVDY